MSSQVSEHISFSRIPEYSATSGISDKVRLAGFLANRRRSSSSSKWTYGREVLELMVRNCPRNGLSPVTSPRFFDQSHIGFHFYPKDQEVIEVMADAIGILDFEIPPGQPEWQVGMARTFDRDFSVLSYLPHMHLRGIAAEYVAYFPDGRVETLLEVPEYDYNWQLDYEYPEPRPFPAGTRIEVKLTYDNSEGNVSNPDPGKAVGFGLETVDEMAFGFMRFVWDETGGAEATAGGGR